MSHKPSERAVSDIPIVEKQNQDVASQRYRKKKVVAKDRSLVPKQAEQDPVMPRDTTLISSKVSNDYDPPNKDITKKKNPRLKSDRGRRQDQRTVKVGEQDTLNREYVAPDEDIRGVSSIADSEYVNLSNLPKTIDTIHDAQILMPCLKSTSLSKVYAHSCIHEPEDDGSQTKNSKQQGTLNVPSIPHSSLPRSKQTTDGPIFIMTRKNASPRLVQEKKEMGIDEATANVGQERRPDKNPKTQKDQSKVTKKKKKANQITQDRHERLETQQQTKDDTVIDIIHKETVALTMEDLKTNIHIQQEKTLLHRSESSLSIKSEKSLMVERDALAGYVGGNIDLLKNDSNDKSTAKKKKKLSMKKLAHMTEEPKSEKEESNKQKLSRKVEGHDPTNHRISEEMSNQRAARQFNKAVRECIELSDPDGIRALLHHKRNHSYALNGDILEMLLKAYVVAAMFEDALYCLRNCTLPGTLRIEQTEKILQCMPQNLRHSSAFVAADMINALCIATEFEKAVHRTYFMRIVRGIALEFLEEATTARDRICSVSCERLVRSGDCVVDARLKRGKRVTEIVVDPGYQLGVFVPDVMENRGIQAGDAVGILPYAGPYPISAESLDRNMIEATVTGIQPMVLRLQDKTNASLYVTLTEPVEGNVYRVDKLANRMGFNRQLAAVVTFCTPSQRIENGSTIVHRYDNRRPATALIKAVTAMDENIDKVMILGGNISRESQLHEWTSTASLCSSAVPWNSTDDSDSDCFSSYKPRGDEDALRDAARLALVKYRALEGLNISQQMAVEGAATNRLTLIQG